MNAGQQKLTPMMRQYQEVKQLHPDAILLFRMGDFYEMFGDDARIAAPILDIVLTSRDKNAQEKMPMCGVPHHAVDSYIARLIAKNLTVAICDQLEDPKTAKGIVKRGLVRVITPGTLLESNLLDSRTNNFIASFVQLKPDAAIALLDMSTGEFAVTLFPDNDDAGNLIPDIQAFNPRELILPRSVPHIDAGTSCTISRQDDWVYSVDYTRRILIEHFKVSNLEGFGIEGMPAAIMAAGSLLNYLQVTHIQTLDHISGIRLHYPDEYVAIDPASRRNLELTRTLIGGTREGSLIHFMDLTQTPMGARLLRRRLEQPQRNPDEINRRMDQVQSFYENDRLRTSIRKDLNRMADLERLAGRVVTGVAHARDLAVLRDSLQLLPGIKTLLESMAQAALNDAAGSIDPLNDVADLLRRSITDSPPLGLKDGNLIREGYDKKLDELRTAARDGKSWIAGLQAKERSRTGIASLKVSFNRVFGYYIEVTHAQRSKVPEDYVRRQTLTSAERYVTPELKEMEDKILGAEEKMSELEFDIFNRIRRDVALQIGRIQQTSKAVAVLDVSCSLAELAVQQRYRRPLVNQSHGISITSGRHPVVERFPGNEGFVPNDVLIDCNENRLLILTGPNMAGKSTYIRQVALLVIMAQMGSFIPAAQAEIGTVDRVFTRVGASDNLAGGQSTFMVEMNETANILNNASSRSLIILDEIGRGTSTFDGLSIAWAVAEYLYHLGARTLFATHYHELTDLSERLPGVRNYNVAVKEWNDQVMFLRTVVPGGVDRSYGIQVARLAGIPGSVIERAKDVLTSLESKEKSRVPFQSSSKTKSPVQMELFNAEPAWMEELRKLNLDELKPIDALNLIARWKKEI